MLCPVCQTPNPDGALVCAACGSPLDLAGAALEPLAPALAPRTPLRGGAFVVEELLGAGGFGLTYRAREVALGREVAVKEFFPFGSTRQGGQVLPPRGVTEAEWAHELAAFRDEAATLARFSHPSIVRAFGVWAEAGTAYFAMEFLRGESLGHRLANGGPLPTDEALGIIYTVGEALSRVHEAGLLHRDIKPDNILLCEGRAVLIDFGTAREFAPDRTTPMTQLLTPGYAPLEQYGRRARFGPFTDVYALAATLYHALCGDPPPPSPDRASGVSLPPLNERNPLISMQLARAVAGALEIPAPKRPQTVTAWLQELRAAQRPAPAPAPKAPTSLIPSATSLIPSPVPATRPPVPAIAPPVPVIEAPTPPDRVFPRASELPPEARTPLWFWPSVFGVPLLLLGWWLFYDPNRADLNAFAAHVRPIVRQSKAVQTALDQSDRTTPERFAAAVGAQVVPAQQAVVDAVQALAPHSDEALWSRDQLLDAESAKLQALQSLAGADKPEDQTAPLQSLQNAQADEDIWRADYGVMLREHRAG